VQVVHEIASQFDAGATEASGGRGEWSRVAHCLDRGLVECFSLRAGFDFWFVVGNRAVWQNVEDNTDSPRRPGEHFFGHYREPVLTHASRELVCVFLQLHASGRRENFNRQPRPRRARAVRLSGCGGNRSVAAARENKRSRLPRAFARMFCRMTVGI
jgi:hypothetical protein